VSATYKITNVLDPTAAQDVATKAYVDAQGGGCYSKCADSGTAAGGATPSCPGGYSSVDTWSERAGFGQYQWGGMNSAAYNIYSYIQHNEPQSSSYRYGPYTNAQATVTPWDATSGATMHTSFNARNGMCAMIAFNTGYSSGSGNSNYYNDCTACCAD